MKKLICILLLLLLSGCTVVKTPQVVATTLPVYEFTQRLCENTDITVGRLVTENVSCLHDYTLTVSQMRMLEKAEIVVINGAGLEDFLNDALAGTATIISAADNLTLLDAVAHNHDHSHGHVHSEDPHIWLSPENAIAMAQNICHELCRLYPQHRAHLNENLKLLIRDLETLQEYGNQALHSLSCRKLITFHDGFSYLAESFDLTVLEALEEESGSEASAEQLIHLIRLTQKHKLPAIFTETYGSVSAAKIIANETGAKIFALDMALAGESYFEAMYRNINTLREALE